jgi:hypothetical protein
VLPRYNVLENYLLKHLQNREKGTNQGSASYYFHQHTPLHAPSKKASIFREIDSVSCVAPLENIYSSVVQKTIFSACTRISSTFGELVTP